MDSCPSVDEFITEVKEMSVAVEKCSTVVVVVVSTIVEDPAPTDVGIIMSESAWVSMGVVSKVIHAINGAVYVWSSV